MNTIGQSDNPYCRLAGRSVDVDEVENKIENKEEDSKENPLRVLIG